MTLKIRDLADALVESCGIPKSVAVKGVEAVFAKISKQVLEGNSVIITNFGGFSMKTKPSRRAMNPQTKEMIQVDAYKKMSFLPAMFLRKVK